MSIHNHIRETVLKTALLHQLKNGQNSPERAARNVKELLQKFNPASPQLISYGDLLLLIKTCSKEECLDMIMQKLN